MTRNLKLLGLMLGAVLAVAAFAASSASAAGFKCDEAPCVLTGTIENTAEGVHEEFTASGVTTKCHVDLEATQSVQTASTLTVSPRYSECTPVLGFTPTVTTNHCAYIFGSVTDANGYAPVETECAEGSKIVMHMPGCTLTFGSQKVGGGVHYTNLGGGKVTVETTLKEIVFEKTAPPEGTNDCGLIFGKGQTQGKLIVNCYKTKRRQRR